ncbi:class I SAM-dependent methyltransferase [Crocosphaera chwakensis]|uniref:Putative glycosyl/methyltransferase hybrid protein n=1 Tax=Crocosphaera chwakensis CCY0110 TaxID=391612 RepID=A3IQN7_9CHRO|nr:class I SAM-dependent methyltransferase [Crocosphaera chwakensis]EAZ91312.1 putative glycosyl/methyltransferase hybrid protein [Crocosphaera chwakensis CCY0110]
MKNLQNTQCIYCHHPSLKFKSNTKNNKHSISNGITCQSCGQGYDILWGVPYLGIFKEEDSLSLLEIIANINNYSQDETHRKDDIKNIIKMINEYIFSDDDDVFFKKHGLERKPDWFDYRYNEQILFKTLTSDLDFKNKTVLDIGAGTGYDGYQYYLAGAEVTCLEFSPVLARVGSQIFPEFQWVGGSADNLPFLNESFDFVVANAALHHLLDIPTSIREMLRVLKPGGFLITIGDSFRGDHQTELDEAIIFNNHVGVLSGINEQVPKFSSFSCILKEFKDNISVQIITKNVYHLSEFPNLWGLEESETILSDKSGDINLLVKKNKSINIEKKTVIEEAFRPYTYGENLVEQSKAISWIVNYIPQKYLNLSVCDPSYPKFRLMNGWKIQEDNNNQRCVYKRGRLFFSRDKIANQFIDIECLVPYLSSFDCPKIDIRINGISVDSKEVIRGVWNSWQISIEEISTNIFIGKAFYLEITLITDNSLTEGQIFWVRKIDFSNEQKGATSEDDELSFFGIETLALTIFKDYLELNLLISPDFSQGIKIINRLKKFNMKLNLVIPQGQIKFYSWLPNCFIVDTYEINPLDDGNYILKDGNILVDIVIASNLDKFLSVLKFIHNNNNVFYVIDEDGTANLLEFPLVNLPSTPSETSSFEHQQQPIENTHPKEVELDIIKEYDKQLQTLLEEIEAMKTSKFWKLRSLWFKLKNRRLKSNSTDTNFFDKNKIYLYKRKQN